jgi:oxaloacetate decarboxylase beta subunit
VAIKAVTTKAERRIRMTYRAGEVSQTAKILFPVVISIVAGLIAPVSLPLVGFLMFGNLLRECGVLDRLSLTAQNELVNIISILLGLSISVSMNYEDFLQVDTLMVIGLGLIAFVMDSIGGVLFAKFINLFRKEKVNPKMATDEDPQNFILMHAAGANVSGQIASVIAGGLLLAFLA